MEVLLTNDDGYDSPGLHAIADALERIADVTVVAPQEDQSAMGRVRSGEVTLDERERGYAVTGTPVDTVLVGLGALELDPDLVVAGCNVGANLGGHALGRSGTVSAAVEATFFGVPAVAVSLYVPSPQWPLNPELTDFREAARATAYLANRAVETDGVPDGGYLNVNAPMPAESPALMRLTRPSEYYDMAAERQGDRIRLRDRGWEELGIGANDEPPTTDRGAVLAGQISVSPLTAPHPTTNDDALQALVDTYEPEAAPVRASRDADDGP